MNSKSGDSAIIPNALATMSNARLSVALKGSSSGVVRSWISLMEPMLSTFARVGMTSL